jgi:hypothetical protein
MVSQCSGLFKHLNAFDVIIFLLKKLNAFVFFHMLASLLQDIFPYVSLTKFVVLMA